MTGATSVGDGDSQHHEAAEDHEKGEDLVTCLREDEDAETGT